MWKGGNEETDFMKKRVAKIFPRWYWIAFSFDCIIIIKQIIFLE